MRFIGCLFIFCCIFFSTYAQQPENKGIEEVAIELPVLPPLSVLIDSALARSPQRLLLDKMKKESQIGLQMTKRDWLKNIQLNSSYNYGKMGSIGNSQGQDGIETSFLTYQAASTYGAGLSMGISVGDILDRKSKIRLAKIQLSKFDDQYQLLRDELALKVSEEYSRLQFSLESLKTSVMLLDSYRAQFVLAEKNYLNNRLKFEEMTAAREAYYRYQLDIKKLKLECQKSVFSLENLTGVRLTHNQRETNQ